MRATRLGLALAALSLACPAAAKVLTALPIAPGGPGQGPWIIAAWPTQDCADCDPGDAARADYAQARDAILSGDFSGLDTTSAKIHLLPARPFGPDTPTATPDELHNLVAACRIDVQHVLRRPATLPAGASFGLTLACPGDEPHRWLSIDFTGGRLADIYYLPGDPIQFAGPDS